MYDRFDPACVPAKVNDFVQFVKDFDFIHLIQVDFNGIPRLIVCPAEFAETLATDGKCIVIAILTFGTDGSVTMIPDHSKSAFGNIRLRPVLETTRTWPWAGMETESRFVQVFTSPEWLYEGEIESDPRHMALQQIKRLQDKGLEILIGVKCQFRLFKAQENAEDDPTPKHSSGNMYLASVIRQYDQFIATCNKRLRSLGVKMELFHNEQGQGQMEMWLSAEWGIKAIDDLVRFKLIIREVAHELGFKASFMTKPIMGESGNGFFFNHSVWSKKGSDVSKYENKMFDENDVDKISNIARKWIAGLLHHTKGLIALWSPTVNCFRRLHTPWTPDYIDWGAENRMASFRLQSGGTHKSTCVENRCPSSASNPYLVIAGTIAAGLDGVERNLELPDEGSKVLGHLPHNLPQALEALKKDEKMCDALGEQFISWYGTMKLEEMSKLESVDLAEERPQDFKKERDMYFDFV